MESTARKPKLGLHELSGAFGDLGVFIPFVFAYISVVRVDAGAVLLAFGVALIAVGLAFRTPFPVQPMKAIGAAAAAHSAQAMSAAAVQAASLATGVIWMLLAFTGLAERLARWVPKGVTLGIVIAALFFSGSVEVLLKLLPLPVLGVILFLAGSQLALGICELGPKKAERFVAITTAAFCLWNVGIAFAFGLTLHHALKRELVRL